ncbi:MAG TPA: tetratricopeptide repeat protein [Candidatus Binatia bacterium]
MIHILRLILLIFTALVVWAAPSSAQSDNAAKKCNAELEQNDFDLAIVYCTAAIESGDFSDQDLAVLFNNRGLAYASKKDYDDAIEDYDQAVRLGKKDSDAFYRRGLVHLNKNDYSRAIQDFDEALKLDPDNVAILQSRGWSYENRNDYEQALRDYDRALSLQSNYEPALVRRAKVYETQRQYERALADYEAATQADPKFASDRAKGFVFFYLGRMTQSAEMFETYLKSHPNDTWAVLFRYLAEAKIGNALAAARELEADSLKLDERRWPAPIIDFYLGRIEEKAMFAAANDPDPRMKNEKTCAANFHAGESRLFRAQVTAAIPLLRAAEKDCPSDFYESHGAAAELRRLGQ